MYIRIKEVGRFVRGLFNSNYRSDCYYQKFSNEWRRFHKNTLEEMEVGTRIHHRGEFDNDCSLVNWIFYLGRV